MADDDGTVFGNLPPPRTGRRNDDLDDRQVRLNRAYRMMRDEEGPLPPRPPGKGGPSINQGPSAPATSTWSAADAALATPPMTLTNNNLTVVYTGSANWQSIRGSISRSSGKYYVEFLANVAPSANYTLFGLAASTFDPTNYIGASNYSGGYQINMTAPYVSAGFAGGSGFSLPAVATNDVIGIAVDFTAQAIWYSRNGVWMTAIPATPQLTFVEATVGALFPALSFHANIGGTWTLQPTAASQKYAPPTGFSAWG